MIILSFFELDFSSQVFQNIVILLLSFILLVCVIIFIVVILRNPKIKISTESESFTERIAIANYKSEYDALKKEELAEKNLESTDKKKDVIQKLIKERKAIYPEVLSSLIEANTKSKKKYKIVYSAITVGSNEKNDICITGYGISKRHALIQYKNNSFYIYDTFSDYGIYLNEKKLLMPRKLNNQDMIQIGEVIFTFEKLDIEC